MRKQGGASSARNARRLGLLFVFCALAGLGCGPGMGDVSGTVTFKGEPLEVGTIQFLGSDGIPYHAKIENGKYSLRVPVGEANVIVSSAQSKNVVDTPKKESKDKIRIPKTAPPAEFGSGIPQKYADWNASGLRTTINRGSNTYSPDLKDD